jgi:predicted transcriptional regulator
MRRSSLEMDIAILQALTGPKPLKLTHIMYRANLNCNILKEKITALEEKGLVNSSSRILKMHMGAPARAGTFYGFTVQGREILLKYNSIYNKLGSAEDERPQIF